jgi:hypothetical protein
MNVIVTSILTRLAARAQLRGLFTVIVAVLLGFTGCASSSEAKSQSTIDGNVVTTFDDPEYGIRLIYPGSWEPAQGSSRGTTPDSAKRRLLLLALPDRPGRESNTLTPAFTVDATIRFKTAEHEATDADVDRLANVALQRAQQEFDRVQRIDVSPTTVAGEPARRVSYAARLSDQHVLVLSVLTAHRGYAFAFTYVADPDAFDHYRDDVERAIRSVQWLR